MRQSGQTLTLWLIIRLNHAYHFADLLLCFLILGMNRWLYKLGLSFVLELWVLWQGIIKGQYG